MFLEMTTRPSIGLALGSGSARGWAHIGVLRGLQRENIAVHIISGTSIGAVVGAAFAAGALDSLESWARKLDWSDILKFVDITIPRSGLIEGEKMAAFFTEQIGYRAIEELPLPFGAVSTDLLSGEEVWLTQGPLFEALRASIAMPGIFTPTLLKGRWLVDGGLVNPIPVSLCRAMGAQVVIAVNLNTGLVSRSQVQKERRARKRKTRQGAPRLGHLISSSLNHGLRRGKSLFFERLGSDSAERGPSLFHVLVTSLHIMQDCITNHRLTIDPPDILISPPLAHVGLLEFHRAQEVIAAGEAALEQVLPRIRKLLG
ncbi:MAG: patatin-like phospholipase family protein [Deltaproteobacteria bacterium]|nr:patatin-like phospholipase family protein [Deltaproteobacteria bacterium]MBW2070477.1 patatin-like phospholipase family protein [Deltaproteobacteria bacterium]